MDNYDQQERLVIALRNYGASHLQLTRSFAESLELHSTDAGALSEIIHAEDRGNLITPAQLAHRLALSRPALSACLNRLEEMQLILRTRESSDRRMVTLRCNPNIYQHAENFFSNISSKMSLIVKEMNDKDVDLICNFLAQASKVIDT